ncbi:MAG: 1-acyl-sn-glycerol-3-phosphate acyltransferase [Pseudomonadota bacterium]
MIRLRGAFFVFLFNLNTFVQMVFWTPLFFFIPREYNWKIVRLWGLSNLWLQHLIIGNTFDFRGLENVPKDGALVASKHQSTWETYATLLFLNDPSYILKRELMYIPFFGWFATKAASIPVNRGKRTEALLSMSAVAKEQFDEDRQIVIYPEGTRKAAFADPAYKYGITYMYEKIEAPVVPVALNSGIFWPRSSFNLKEGHIVLEFLPKIAPGLSPEVFSAKLQSKIEQKTAELLAEAQ